MKKRVRDLHFLLRGLASVFPVADHPTSFESHQDGTYGRCRTIAGKESRPCRSRNPFWPSEVLSDGSCSKRFPCGLSLMGVVTESGGFLLPPPLWGRVGVGGRLSPPTPTLPHKGGGGKTIRGATRNHYCT